jgi:hypothetical protein
MPRESIFPGHFDDLPPVPRQSIDLPIISSQSRPAHKVPGSDRFMIITIRDSRLKTAGYAAELDAAIIWMKRMKANHEPCCLVDTNYGYETLGSRLAEFLIIERGIGDSEAKIMMMNYMRNNMV